MALWLDNRMSTELTSSSYRSIEARLGCRSPFLEKALGRSPRSFDSKQRHRYGFNDDPVFVSSALILALSVASRNPRRLLLLVLATLVCQSTTAYFRPYEAKRVQPPEHEHDVKKLLQSGCSVDRILVMVLRQELGNCSYLVWYFSN